MVPLKRFALITGCGRGGIGDALAKEYASRGIHSIATVLPLEASDHLSGPEISCFKLDVTREDSIVDFKEQVRVLTGGRLDILVNNAGICYTMTAIDTDIHSVTEMFDVNVFGPMRMVQHFHPMLIKASGTIINIGSVGGIVPYLYGSSYNATKAALHHWSNTLRVEMKPLQVKVITVISGEIGTNILKRDQERVLPEGSYYSPLADEFKNHVQRIPRTTSRFEYASKVVSESLRDYPSAWFWYGSTSSLVRLFETFGFRTLWDYIFWRVFNLSKLYDAHKSERKTKKDL